MGAYWWTLTGDAAILAWPRQKVKATIRGQIIIAMKSQPKANLAVERR
jgi:hypothetical protein